MNMLRKVCPAFVCTLAVLTASAQRSMDGMQLLTVNENVTTVITASEPVRFVDISTEKVAGDQPINNTVRLKPKEGVEVNRDGDILAVVTVVTVVVVVTGVVVVLVVVMFGLFFLFWQPKSLRLLGAEYYRSNKLLLQKQTAGVPRRKRQKGLFLSFSGLKKS